jgi:hypothetical protein
VAPRLCPEACAFEALERGIVAAAVVGEHRVPRVVAPEGAALCGAQDVANVPVEVVLELGHLTEDRGDVHAALLLELEILIGLGSGVARGPLLLEGVHLHHLLGSVIIRPSSTGFS